MSRVYAWFILSLYVSILYSCTTGEAGMVKKTHPRGSGEIRLNQVGFYPLAPKRAIVMDSLGDSFKIISIANHAVVFEGSLSEAKHWEYSGEKVRIADFSSLEETGTYRLELAGGESSHAFDIGENIHTNLHKASLKSFYYQRASLELTDEIAGTWARESGHTDKSVKVHYSAATKSRPTGTLIAAPKGWYDAGDYGKYTANAAYATWIMLHYYEQFPSDLQAFTYDLPESQNAVPDILDEALWSLRWLLRMQDPQSGMVYHKLTGLKHPRKVMPEDDEDERYVIGKSTGTNLGYAALMAQASRVFANFSSELPGLADSCKKASLAAWKWGLENPNKKYQNPPDIHTGQYKDGSFEDEFAWAAMELFITTKDESYLSHSSQTQKNWRKPPGWNSVGVLAWMSINLHADKFPNKTFTKDIRTRFLSMTDVLVKQSQESPYHVPLGRDKYDFIWGSNGIAASSGMILVHAYTISKARKYQVAAIDMLDYILGRNATGYCFVSGSGSLSPLNIHHRPSESDDIAAPIPGFLVGGPQGEKNYDGCEYPSVYPAAFYADLWCSYSTNEVCLNWNAPLVYLAGGLDFLN